jgi:hypothetical protein
VAEYEVMQEQIELLQDIQISIEQLNNKKGVEHLEAKKAILRKVSAQ